MDNSLTAIAEAGIDRAQARIVAHVLIADHAVDLAFALCPERLAVLRCAEEARLEDHAALKTMVVEGDFIWAGLVYADREGSDLLGPIDCFHVSEFDRLVGVLVKLRVGVHEAG